MMHLRLARGHSNFFVTASFTMRNDIAGAPGATGRTPGADRASDRAPTKFKVHSSSSSGTAPTHASPEESDFLNAQTRKDCARARAAALFARMSTNLLSASASTCCGFCANVTGGFFFLLLIMTPSSPTVNLSGASIWSGSMSMSLPQTLNGSGPNNRPGGLRAEIGLLGPPPKMSKNA